MQVGLRQFDAGTIERLIAASRDSEATRGNLARLLCELEEWRDSGGKLAVSSARKLLPRLAAKAGFALPVARSGVPAGAGAALPVAVPAGRGVGEVWLDPVSGKADRRRWEAMIEAWHPLGWRRAPGGQMRYWIRSSERGVVGGLGFCAASWHQKARDDWIGWSGDARVANLGAVICNHRFLVLARVHGLASRVLGLAAARVADDWASVYGVRPVLAYTYVGPEHGGRSYEAAGWSRCPEPTSGKPPGRAALGPRRAVWMKPLSAGWRERLCAEPARPIVAPKPTYLKEAADWADREYARSSHPDGRVRDRIVRMGRSWLRNLGCPIPALFPVRAERKAAYRLLSNDGVSMEHVLESHHAATAERCARERVVLAVQDTTTLNYEGLKATAGLVGIGGRGKGAHGLMAHFGLAINPVGRPLGLFQLDADFRVAADGGEDGETESRRWLEGFDRARELAAACPGTRVITVCDREADIWELFRRAAGGGGGLVVRANRSRKRRVLTEDGTRKCLWEHVAGTAPLGTKKIVITACGGPRRRKGRQAKLDLRACFVTLAPPTAAADQTPTRMLAVSATERDAPQGKDPLCWLLLTTEGDATLEDARQAVSWYEHRWKIETWFAVLKTGTRVADRQLDDADDLRKCLAFDAITACHVHDLTFMARTRPDTPADKVVEQDEIECLYNHLQILGVIRARPPPGYVPSIAQFVIDLASIAGFESRKVQPLPGTRKLWEALIRFMPVLSYHRGMLKQQQNKNSESYVGG